MKIKLWIEDMETGQLLEDLGECLCDSPARAAQMYQDIEAAWCDKGYMADTRWTEVSTTHN